MSGQRPNVTTVDEVKERIEEIKAAAGDPEVAHSLEDDLHAQVLFAIANLAPINGPRWAQEFASAARASYRIDFPRWCA